MLKVIKITDTKKFAGPGLKLAIQAVMERGLNGVDFDKTDFSDKCKMLFVSPAMHKWALVANEQLIGFIVASMTQNLWQKAPFLDIVVAHIAPEYRTVEAHQALMNAVYNFAKQKNITEITCKSDLFVMGKDQTSFLLRNGFNETSQNWERTLDY